MEGTRPVFPKQLQQNGCKLMAAHRAYRQGAWHLLPDPVYQQQQRQTPHGLISSDYSLDAVRTRFGHDVACICAHLNRQLADSKLASAYLPLSEANLFEQLQNGVLLCSLVNVIKPGTIDESVVGSTLDVNTSSQKKGRNLSLAICSLEAVGINLGGLTVACLDRADCGIYVGILLQALHRSYLPDRSSTMEFQRWIRDCLGNGYLGNERAACKRLTSLVGLENPQANIKSAMKSIDMDGLLKPEHLEGDDNNQDGDESMNDIDTSILLRASLLRRLYLACMWLRSTNGGRKLIAKASDHGHAEAVAAVDEVSVKIWINSLGVEPPVSELGDDLRDGLILLQAWEAISPGSVNWPSVAMTTRTEAVAEEEAEGSNWEAGRNLANCVLVVECARQHGMPVELALAEFLAVGDVRTTLDLVLSMMRLHSLKQYRRAVGNCGELVGASTAVFGWANAQLMSYASDGVGFQLTGADDPSLRGTTVLGYLGERILISSGRLEASSTEGMGAAAATIKVAAGAAVGFKRAAIPAPTMLRKRSLAAPLLNSSAAVGKKMAKVVKVVKAVKGAPGLKAIKAVKGLKGLKGAKGAKDAALDISEGDELTEEMEEEPVTTAKVAVKGAKGIKAAKGAKGLKQGPLEAAEVEYTDDEEDVHGSLHKSPAKGAKGLKGIKGAKGLKAGKGAKGLTEAFAAAEGETQQAKFAKKMPPLKSAKGAKGMKAAKNVANNEAEEAEEMEPALEAKPPMKGAKGLKGAKGAKGVKGAKGAKGVAPALEEGAEYEETEMEETPIAGKSPAKGAKGMKAAKGAKGVKGVKGVKGAKGLAAALTSETEGEEAVEGLESLTPAKGVKGLKSAKCVKGAKGAKGLKGVKAQATAADEEEATEEVGETEPATGKLAPVKGKLPGKVVKKGAKAGLRLKNVNAVPLLRGSNSTAAIKRVPLLQRRQAQLPNRQYFSRVSTLTSSEQQAEYSRQTIGMLRLCGISVLAARLGPGMDSAMYLDVLMQLHSVSVLAEAAKAAVAAPRTDRLEG